MAQYLLHAYEPSDPSQPREIHFRMADYQFRIPPFEPFEMDYDSNGRKIEHADFFHHKILEEYGPLYGFVDIPTRRERTGVVFDIDAAVEHAEKTLKRNRIVRITEWVQDQMQNRVRQNLPVLAPTGFVSESLILLNINLSKRYKLNPVGWEEGENLGLVDNADHTPINPQLASAPVQYMQDPEQARKLAEVQADNEMLKEEMAAMSASFEDKFAQLLAAIQHTPSADTQAPPDHKSSETKTTTSKK